MAGIYYNEDQKTVKRMAKFMSNSRKLTGTTLNKQPKVGTDSFDNPKLNTAPRGLAHGLQLQEKLNNQPANVRKKISEQKPGKQASKLMSSKQKAGNNKRNKGMNRRFK